MLDGLPQSVLESDIVRSPHPTGSDENWAGNAFGKVDTELKHTGEGRRMACADKERSWSVVATGGEKNKA